MTLLLPLVAARETQHRQTLLHCNGKGLTRASPVTHNPSLWVLLLDVRRSLLSGGNMLGQPEQLHAIVVIKDTNEIPTHRALRLRLSQASRGGTRPIGTEPKHAIRAVTLRCNRPLKASTLALAPEPCP